MKRFWTAPLLALGLVLAGCGNNSPVPPPTTTTGGTTGTPTTTGGTTGGTTGFPTTTGGFPTTTGGFPTTTGGTTGATTGTTTSGTTTGSTTGTTTGGTTTGGTTGTISGTVTAPSGGTLTGGVVIACLQTDTECENGAVAQVASTGSYTLTGLQTAPYEVVALADVDGSRTLTNGDYIGGYTTDGTNLTPVTPPATGIDINLVVYTGGGTGGGDLTGTWTGTTTTTRFGNEGTTFELIQSGSDVTGTLALVGSPTVDIEGSVSGSSVTLSAGYSVNGVPLNYVYEGTLSGTTLSGSVTLLDNGVEGEIGQFSVTRSSASTAPLDKALLNRVFKNIR